MHVSHLILSESDVGYNFCHWQYEQECKIKIVSDDEINIGLKWGYFNAPWVAI